MATLRLPILGGSTNPVSPVFMQPADIIHTTSPSKAMDFIFPFSSTKDALHGRFAVPIDYVDTANLVIVWDVNATSNDVEWDWDYRTVAGNDAESFNQAGSTGTVGTNDTAGSAAFERMELTIALTDGDFVAKDTVDFILFRDQVDAGDTTTIAVTLKELFFEYNDA